MNMNEIPLELRDHFVVESENESENVLKTNVTTMKRLQRIIRKGEFRWKATKNCSLKDFIAAVTGKCNM